MAAQKQDDQLERTFSSYVRIQDVTLKTYLGRWTIGRSGERGSGISVLPARYDDDDDETVLTFKFLKWLECSPMARKTWIQSPGRVIPKTQKVVLDTSLLNTAL